MVHTNLELVSTGNGEHLGHLVTEALRYCMQSLAGHSGGSLEDQTADRNVASLTLPLRFTEGNKYYVRK